MKRRGRLARAERRAEEAEAERDDLTVQLGRAEREIERLDHAGAAMRAEVDTLRRTLLCVALLTQEDRTVETWTRDARQATRAVQPAHQVA